jgi:RNA polymerase sigma-70 factor (ECF subfamily)
VSRGLRLVPLPPAPLSPPVARAAWRPTGQDDQAGDADLAAALRAEEPWAAAALVERYGALVRRVLMRTLGSSDSEHADLVQEVFIKAWKGACTLSDGRSLKPWILRIAVFTARGAIRRRQRRRWLSFLGDVPEPEPTWAGPDLQEAAQCVYRILDRMPADERLAFSLRTLGGLDLEATAHACGMSFATVRRRLARAERRFFKLARECEALAPWLDELERGAAEREEET